MIDIEALRRIVKGDPDTKVTVRRAWLAEVLKQLDGLEEIRKPKLDMFEALTEGLDNFLKKRA